MNSRIFNNMAWIIFSRIVQSVLALFVSMLSARYLGPANFGKINYAASIVAFVLPIMYLGINNILVQEIINNKNDEGKILGTAIVTCVFSSFICVIGIAMFGILSNGMDKVTLIVCILYSTMLIFQATELLQYWFQAKLKAKYVAVVSLIAYIVVSCYKIILLISQRSVYWFAVSNAFDYFLVSIGLFIVYNKLGGQKLSFSLKIAKRLFLKGRHYIVSSMMITIFANTDKIMLKSMINETAVGYYAVAVTCTGITSFVFRAIIDSFRPMIFEKRAENDINEYVLNLKRMYSVIIYLALAQSLIIALLSKVIVYILYGAEYLAAARPLRIIVWYTTFSYLGAARDVWILAEGKQRYLWIINLSGALMNIVLNLILIPLSGIEGAAVASLITQIFTNVIIGYIISPIRENNKIIVSSLNPKCIAEMAAYILRKLKILH